MHRFMWMAAVLMAALGGRTLSALNSSIFLHLATYCSYKIVTPNLEHTHCEEYTMITLSSSKIILFEHIGSLFLTIKAAG